MSIVFYSAPMSSATPVATALAELDVPHERVTFDLARGDQKSPDFLRINPNGKVPTLVVDGAPLFEALAILLWLGERFGTPRGLWPKADTPERLRAVSWSTWAYVTFGSPLQRYFWVSSERVSPEMRHAGQAEAAKGELDHLLGLLDAELAKSPYLLGQDYSLADLVVASVVGYGAMSGVSVERHESLRTWLSRCQSRPAFRSTWQ